MSIDENDEKSLKKMVSEEAVAQGRSVTRADAEAAVKTLIFWAGDDPEREGLLKTPGRVVNSYAEYYSGYGQSPEKYLGVTYQAGMANYRDILMVRNITVASHCEHHMVPMVGVAHVGYIPNGEVVGLSKVARLVDIYAKRLQIQERMTLQIAEAFFQSLSPLGVAVVMTLRHDCMCRRGVSQPNSETTSVHMLGCFNEDAAFCDRFYALLGLSI